MSDELRESLSALMDGEASELELRRVLRDGNSETEAYWGRIQRQRNILRGDPDFPGLDVSARVRSAIAQEVPHSARRTLEWRKPLAGLAVAASVAALVVFGLGGANQSAVPTLAENGAPATGQESGRVYLASPQSSVGAVTASATTGSIPRYQQVDDKRSRERFEKFLQQHTERAALNNGQGMVTYARLVSHEVE
ncbi:sigma-E factor negative regulatory protein [Litorivivens sp.]|uniref:sigma-E factor negative regulatory protein n=1 Tax=Litorivivens sp. TaxID=2020868 RepID=UPI00356ACC32